MSKIRHQNIQKEIAESIKVKSLILENLDIIYKIDKIAEICTDALKSSKKIIFAGNGGSFADAQHLCAEFVSKFKFNRSPLNSICLGTNSSTISAIGNDFGFNKIFKREIEAYGNCDDIFIVISTSGMSKNLIEAVKVAQQKKIKVFGLTGITGGNLLSMCECICVPSKEIARIQECHILIGHIICGIVEEKLFVN